MLSRLAFLLVASLTHGALVARPLSGFPSLGSSRTAAASVADDSRPLNVRVAPRSRSVLMADAAVANEAETYQFEAEVTKVMDIIINSLYSDKDIVRRTRA
jgi:heat shock protein beta